jgi:hypothetical protein
MTCFRMSNALAALAGASMLALLIAPGALAQGNSGASASGDAAMCRVDEDATRARAAAAFRAMEHLKRLQQEAVDHGEVVVLDGRGYRYPRERDLQAELALLHAEARRQRQQR